MSWTFIVIIGVLIYIAYQLSQLNRGKKIDLEIKIAEKDEQKIKELFPHLYLVASGDIKEEIKDFVTQNMEENITEVSSDGVTTLAGYIYSERYKIINEKIDAETNSQKKQEFKNIEESISKDLERWDNRLDSMVNKGKISEWEKDFILWNFLKPINDQFPERHFELDDYFNSRFGRLQLQ